MAHGQRMEHSNVVGDCREIVLQLLYSYPETIDAITIHFDDAFDYILETYDRSRRNKIFADELMGILQSNDSDIAESVGVIMDIFRYHGICAIRVPPYNKLSFLNWGDNYYNFVKLGPLLVARGRGQTRQEDDDVLDAAESLCRIRLSNLQCQPLQALS